VVETTSRTDVGPDRSRDLPITLQLLRCL